MRFAIKSVAALLVYVMLIWLMQPLGWIGLIAALISGTSVTGMILLSRRQDVIPVIRVIVYMVLGALLAGLVPDIGRNAIQRGATRLLSFAIMGALIAMIINASAKPPSDDWPTSNN